MTPFVERAVEMGLDTSLSYKGLYRYEDRYSKVVYRVLGSQGTPFDDPNGSHPTDGDQTNLIGVWTAPPQSNEYNYVGYVSRIYKFLGNAVLVDRVYNSLQEVGNPILQTSTTLLGDLTGLRENAILQSSQSVAQVGDIHPAIIISNSYNGTRAATVGFGISIENGRNERVVFGFSMGEMRMIHIESSNTRLTSGINLYMEVFNDHILEMISRSFNTQLTEDQMFATLDIIEKYGKRRREKITEILQSIQPPAVEGQPPPLPSAWNIFLAIVRYCSLEPNLNMTRMLENIAESVLIVPPRMIEVLNTLNNN